MSLLLISGSLRDGSTNTALLRTAQAIDADTELFEGMRALPHFSPDDDGDDLPAAVRELRAATGRAEAILVCTPEYAGALPGAFKNLLEWLVGGGEAYRKPIAWINVSGPAAPSGAADAHDSLRKVVGYLSMEIVEEACVRIPVARDAIGADGLIADPAIREPLAAALGAARGRGAGGELLAPAAFRGAKASSREGIAAFEVRAPPSSPPKRGMSLGHSDPVQPTVARAHGLPPSVMPSAPHSPTAPYSGSRATAMSTRAPRKGTPSASSSARWRSPLASEPSARTTRCHGTVGSSQANRTAPAWRGAPGETSP